MNIFVARRVLYEPFSIDLLFLWLCYLLLLILLANALQTLNIECHVLELLVRLSDQILGWVYPFQWLLLLLLKLSMILIESLVEGVLLAHLRWYRMEGGTMGGCFKSIGCFGLLNFDLPYYLASLDVLFQILLLRKHQTLMLKSPLCLVFFMVASSCQLVSHSRLRLGSVGH